MWPIRSVEWLEDRTLLTGAGHDHPPLADGVGVTNEFVGPLHSVDDGHDHSSESLGFVPHSIYYRAPGDDDFMPPHFHGGLPASGGELENSEFSFDDTDRWTNTVTNGSGLQQGDPTTLTWSFVPDGTSIFGYNGEPTSDSNLIAFLGGIYGVTTNDTNYTDEPWFGLFESYLNRWGEVSGLTYTYEPNDDGAAFTS
ncbi:MAG: hypothetical protein KDA80_01225, partial [Planctomycetaceae bacterium]|nr:hypothetical protein [Planctomycetaceae bacterium]